MGWNKKGTGAFCDAMVSWGIATKVSAIAGLGNKKGINTLSAKLFLKGLYSFQVIHIRG
jgi:hypothetical protein